MVFYLKRYLAALRSQQRLVPLILLPLLVYLVGAAFLEREFSIQQDFSYSGNVLVAKNRASTIRLDELLADPNQLLLEGFAITQLQRNLDLLPETRDFPRNEGDLRRLVHESLALVGTGGSGARLGYLGQDKALGLYLVEYFSERLMQRIEDARDPQTSTMDSAARFEKSGEILISASLSPWSPDRLRPSLILLGLSLLLFAVAVAFLEIANPAVKSERQIARYLDLPVLGSLPNAEPLARRLTE